MNMKKLSYSILLLTTCCLQANAQHVSFGPLHSADNPRENWILPGDTLLQDGKKLIYNGKPTKNTFHDTKGNNSPSVSLGNPAMEIDSTFFYNPIANMGYGQWESALHQGLNVSLGLSAFATFGKNAPHHGGFTQDISLTYLTPLTKDGKLWMAAGGYLCNMNWGGDSYHTAALHAMLGYRFDEHWEAYIYGQLNVDNNYANYYGYPYDRYGLWYSPLSWNYPMRLSAGANVIGAGVRYHVNKNFSFGINIEGAWYDNKTPSYHGKYNYPIPPIPTDN